MGKKWIISALLFLILPLCLHSQDTITPKVSRVSKSDSAKVSTHSPTTAMLLSIIPGGGQIYNKKYWKLPIVYSTIGASSYMVYYFAKDMITYKNEFIYRRDGKTELLNPKLEDYSSENILAMKQTAQRNMEIAIAVTAILYTLNIIDAMVDAHLFYFDVSDDLSLKFSPAMLPSYASNKPSYGLGINIKF